jgi:hypothetical protein
MKASHFESGLAQRAGVAALMRDDQLSVNLQSSIATLAAKGWSSRKIAREPDLDRETGRQYRPAPDSKPAIVPAGSDAVGYPAAVADGPPVAHAIESVTATLSLRQYIGEAVQEVVIGVQFYSVVRPFTPNCA